jgi:hypothetical protein
MATKRFAVERLFPLGDYKNIKYHAEMVLEDAEVDVYPAEAVYDALTNDIYQAYFAHAAALDGMKQAGGGRAAQVEAWNKRNTEEE